MGGQGRVVNLKLTRIPIWRVITVYIKYQFPIKIIFPKHVLNTCKVYENIRSRYI